MPGAWGAPFKGNTGGAWSIFRVIRRVRDTALRLLPTLKRPCAILPRTWGTRQIQSTPRTASRENRHTPHFGQDQKPLTPHQSTLQSTHQTTKSRHFQLSTKSAYSLPTHITPLCLKQTNQPPKNNKYPLTSWPLSGGWREPVSLLIYRLLFI